MNNITPEQLYKLIGKNVAKYRKEKGLSQLDLSLSMGYKSVSVVSGAEIYYNKIHFNLEHILKISQLLDIEFCEFFKETSLKPSL
jgi:transcriptional regulator with XRE-family HTH domain